jgi:carbon storage regulator
MLVLTRRVQESVHISDSIVVQVLSIKGNRVQLGISACPEVRIARSELLGRSRCEPASGSAVLRSHRVA